MGVIKGDTRSLDYKYRLESLYNPSFHFIFHFLFPFDSPLLRGDTRSLDYCSFVP